MSREKALETVVDRSADTTAIVYIAVLVRDERSCRQRRPATLIATVELSMGICCTRKVNLNCTVTPGNWVAMSARDADPVAISANAMPGLRKTRPM